MKTYIVTCSTSIIAFLAGVSLEHDTNKQKITYLESELKSVRYHYLKCTTELLDSNLHKNCFNQKNK